MSRLVVVVVLLGGLVAGCTGSGPAEVPCNVTSECPSEQICLDGICQTYVGDGDGDLGDGDLGDGDLGDGDLGDGDLGDGDLGDGDGDLGDGDGDLGDGDGDGPPDGGIEQGPPDGGFDAGSSGDGDGDVGDGDGDGDAGDGDGDGDGDLPCPTGCSDGVACNGEEACLEVTPGAGDYACFAGTALSFDDGNTCTQNLCAEPGVADHPSEPDGTACTETGRDGLCGSGTCQIVPAFSVSDPLGVLSGVARHRSVEVTGIANGDFDGFLLREDPAMPDPDDGAWSANAPTSFTLSSTPGSKTVHLWVQIDGAVVASPATASITLGLVELGVTAGDCTGVCSVVGSALEPLNEALALVPAGGRLLIAPGNYRFGISNSLDADDVLIESTTGDPRDVVFTKDEGIYVEPGALNLRGNRATVRGLSLVGGQGIYYCITANLSTDSNDRDGGWTNGHLIEQNLCRSTHPAFTGSNSTVDGIFPGDQALVRNNIVLGWFERGVNLTGAATQSVIGTTVVHNSFFVHEHFTSGTLRVRYAEDIFIGKNLFVALNDEGPAVTTSNTSNVTLEDNVFWPFVDLGAAGASQRCDPGLVRYDDVVLGAGSCALDAVSADAAAGDTDAYGGPRTQGSAADIGALEGSLSASTLPSISLSLTAGPTTNDCPGGCDFTGAAAGDVLVDALSAAPPGATLVLHGGASPVTTYGADGLIIDRPMALLRDPTAPLGSIVLANSGDALPYDRGMITVTQAEDVVIKGLTFECNANCWRAIWIDDGTNTWGVGPSAADRALITGNHMIAVSGSTVEDFVRLGNDTVVRQNLAEGILEAFADHRGAGGTIMFNTWVSRETSNTQEVQVLRLVDSVGLTVANNLFDASLAVDPDDERAGALIDELTTTGLVLRNNLFFNVQLADDGGDLLETRLDANSNCTTQSTYVDMTTWCSPEDPLYDDVPGGDYGVRTGSAAHDQGNPSDLLLGEVDLWGDARDSAGPDIGALEHDGF